MVLILKTHALVASMVDFSDFILLSNHNDIKIILRKLITYRSFFDIEMISFKIMRFLNTNEVTIYIKTREQEVNELLSENHLVIIKNSVNECFGETARDSIDDVSKNSIKESWSRII
ncbi:unnamed protein product [Rhizophagus irregularis]|nr:unnamed protein product [Rhizophagus irregularis]